MVNYGDAWSLMNVRNLLPLHSKELNAADLGFVYIFNILIGQ